MLILPALATLFTYLYWRPHQIFEVLQAVTINGVLAFALFSYALDLRAGRARFRGSPLLVLVALFTVWCFVTVLLKAPDQLREQYPKLTLCLLIFLLVSQGLQSLRALKLAVGFLMVFTIALAALGVEQGLSPTLCYVRGDSELAEETPPGFDGRPCATRGECYDDGLPGAEYSCEHPGWLGTSSIGGRVRYLGMLEDPNELAWALSMGMPFFFFFYEAKRSPFRLLLLLGGIVVTTTCVIMTQSRSGQLSLLASFGVYFIRRYRGRGLIAAVVAGLPVLLLGGRSGESADSSTEERLACWSEGLSMWKQNPVVGVGSGQFIEHYAQTAHNSYLLTLAELGPIGFFLWTAAVYLAIKVTVRIQIELRNRTDAEGARSCSIALLASMVGLIVSVLFLSLPYHPILWIFVGLTAALYGIVRLHAPDFRVKFGGRDLMIVGALDVGLLVAISVYLRIKGV